MIFPFDSLAPHVERRYRPKSDRVAFIGIRGKAAQVLGVSVDTVARWQARGLSLDLADRMAVELGLHPADIWPELWWLQPCGCPVHLECWRHLRAEAVRESWALRQQLAVAA